MDMDPVDKLLHDPRFAGAPVTWESTPEQYRAIRHAWLTHVSAEEDLFVPFTEERFAERMATMLSVFSDACTMELAPTGERWEGKVETVEFYRQFLGSFTGMSWVPQALVIGPQGVLDVVDMEGVVTRPFAGQAVTGEPVHLQWVISFPWVPAEGRFRGETVYSIRPL